LLEITELVKVYPGPLTALRGVDLAAPQGLFGLLGPNGAGKSTLMRIVAGLLAPTSGRVRFAGEDVVEHPERLRSRLGYLPQQFGFHPQSTGEEMLTYLLALKGVTAPGGTRALARQLLERVNLAAAARQKIGGWSGGMRQRLGIAQALAGDPALIIVDEPTAGLDPEERVRFYRLLAELAAERTVLLSTHIVEDVAVLCPRFALLYRGRTLAVTTPSEARSSLSGTMFEGDRTARTLGELPAGAVVAQAYLVEGRHRLRLHVPGGEAPPGFHATAPTLEDYYFVRTAAQAGQPR
jgi:ABC-2 type transport system ATP-binding protein